MKNHKRPESRSLRQKAEEELKSRFNMLPDHYAVNSQNPEVLKYIHELEIHQIELEMQNEELLLAQSAAQDTLKERENRYSDIFHTVSEGIIHTTAAGDVISINESFEQIMDMPNVEIIGKNLLNLAQEYLAAESIQAALPFLQNLIQGRKNQAFQIEYKNKIIEVDATINKENGHLTGILRDITKLKKSEAELEESREKYRGLSEAAFESIFISEKGICIEQNQSAEKIFGYTPEEAIGRYGTEWIAPQDREMVMQNMLRGYQEPYEALALKKDGTTFPCMLRGKMMFYKGKSVRVTSLSDITAQKKIENELRAARIKAEESDKLKSAFLANMSHEIRTPMNGILGFSNLLKEPHLSGEEQQEYIKIIEKSGARMLNIINDIVDISKIETGQIEVSIKETNIHEQIEFVLNFFKPDVEKKGIQLLSAHDMPLNGCQIRTDREKLYAILINLANNAIKHTQKGSVEIGVEKKDGSLEFFVKDTGKGIPEDQREIIFERFRQGNDLITKPFEGTGLGLSISKAYVEMLGGKIWLESELGKGSTFYFTLPRNLQSEAEIIRKDSLWGPGVNTQGRNLKILIVEDDDVSVFFLAKALKGFYSEILTAGTGVEAVKVCRNNPDLDLVLMDVRMPGMDGYTAIRQIRQFNKDLIIIAQTAFGLCGDKHKAMEAGCNDYLAKPIIKEELLSLIKKYFEGRA